MGHFASLAQGFGLPATAKALQEAKRTEPDHLSVPQDEVPRIETDDGSEDTIGAVATSIGVLPIPVAAERFFRTSIGRSTAPQIPLQRIRIGNQRKWSSASPTNCNETDLLVGHYNQCLQLLVCTRLTCSASSDTISSFNPIDGER
jgi:hypothetical protein